MLKAEEESLCRSPHESLVSFSAVNPVNQMNLNIVDSIDQRMRAVGSLKAHGKAGELVDLLSERTAVGVLSPSAVRWEVEQVVSMGL